MLNKLKKQSSEGFTIIEVMIVLAIAGLILLIVLLAVPALQRNSRNTTIKSDAASIVGAAATYMSDNEGETPNNIYVGGGEAILWKASANTIHKTKPATIPATSMRISIQKSTTLDDSFASTLPTDANVNNNALKSGVLYPTVGITCDGNLTTRSIAISYVLETSKGLKKHCVNS